MAQRDTTKALNYATLALNATDDAQRDSYLHSLIRILVDIDGRTTSRDPHLKPKRR